MTESRRNPNQQGLRKRRAEQEAQRKVPVVEDEAVVEKRPVVKEDKRLRR
jgi:hypothetical protein